MELVKEKFANGNIQFNIYDMAAKSLLSLASGDALDFFMQSEQFHDFELPEYFDFSKVLQFVKERIGDSPYEECVNTIGASRIPDVNFDILLNKDGKYAVRPLLLCNPYLYYFLCRELCCAENWDAVRKHFESCTVPNISLCAMPVIPEEVEQFHKATVILNWWNSMEQRSIELSLEYRYMFVSDIANCYGSVNPQSIDWALSRKGTKKETSKNHGLASAIMRYLIDFQYGRNIGIPQGCTVFHLIAEIILSYADLLLHERIRKSGIREAYTILRYRDDYRIFCNNKDALESISYLLQQVLESLNFRMNTAKTRISDSVITDSIKPDKLAYIYNTPIFNKKNCDFDGLQKYLLYILMFGRKYPDAGQLKTLLSDFDRRVMEKLKPRKVFSIDLADNDSTSSMEEVEMPGKLSENVRAMTAIATQIALENVSVTHYALRVISRMLDSVKEEEEHDDLVDKVCKKLINRPNSTYSKLWLQNMTYQQDVRRKKCPYDSRLCRLVMGEDVELWNLSWLKPEYAKDFPQSTIIDKEALAKVSHVITFRETRSYWDWLESLDREGLTSLATI